MAGKQAKILSADHIDDLLFFADRSRHPLRNRVIVLLSVKAGLRAAEIAKLTWPMIVNPSGEINSIIELKITPRRKEAVAPFPCIPICETRWLRLAKKLEVTIRPLFGRSEVDR
jgi:hypothetical protein